MFLIIIIVAIIALDQWSKWAIKTSFNLYQSKPVIQDLLQGEPMISVAPSETENALLLNPMTVKDGEPSIIKERILEVMG